MQVHLSKNTQTDMPAVLERAATLAPEIEAITTVVAESTLDNPHASVNAPTDTTTIEAVKQLVTTYAEDTLRYIFVVGIGGSNLGTKAIYDALYGYTNNSTNDRPVMIFLDTNNDAHLTYYLETVVPTLQDSKEYVVVPVSKSGGTTETIMNTELLVAALQKSDVYAPERVVAITDAESALDTGAAAAGWQRLHIPDQVGGRYSVLTAVGLFPLALVGVDIDELLHGAIDMRGFCLLPEVAHNPAAQSASFLSLARESGHIIHDSFFFHTELESMGKWYRQLTGESIGKEKNIHGDTVHTGFTPTVSIGSTDLHSVGQLYLGGPQDKVTSFIYSSDTSAVHQMPTDRVLPDVVSMIAGASSHDVRTAIIAGTQVAYQKQQLPYMEIEFAKISAYELGAFMQYKMLEMMYLGALLEVNPFDQPNVESYKIETKQLLEANE